MKAVVTVRPIPHYNMVRFCNLDKCLQQLLTLIKCCVPGPVVWPVQPLHLPDTPMREVLSLHWLILWVGNVRLGRLSHRPKAHRASRVGICARVWPQSQCFWQFLQKLSFFSVLREKVGPQTSTVPSSVSSKKKKKQASKKNPPARRCWFNPWSGRSPAEGNGNTLLQFSCLGNLMDKRSLVGYSPWGRKRVGHNFTTKQQNLSLLEYPNSLHLLRF